jgi:hypothetical protein
VHMSVYLPLPISALHANASFILALAFVFPKKIL